MEHDACTTARLAVYRYVARVAPKKMNKSLNPLQGEALIEQTGIDRRAVGFAPRSPGVLKASEEAEGRKLR